MAQFNSLGQLVGMLSLRRRAIFEAMLRGSRRRKARQAAQARQFASVELCESRTLLSSVDLLSFNDPANPGDTAGGFSPSVSADGRYVVFVSDATNIVPGQVDTNGVDDVFLLDRQTGTITLVSHTGDGVTTGSGESGSAVISADGSAIAYESLANDLIAGQVESNGYYDVFRFDVASGTNELVSHNGDQVTTGNGGAYLPVISADGQTIAYVSWADDLASGTTDANGQIDVFRYVAGSRTNHLVSHIGDGVTAANSWSDRPVISADGTAIAFESAASNLVSGVVDTNGFQRDVYRYSVVTGQSELVSHTGDQFTTANGDSRNAVINADGTVVAYQSWASDIVPGVTDNNTVDDVFRYDSATGSNVLVSHTGLGNAAGNARSENAVISADGQIVAYQSTATNLVSGVSDFNSAADVFRFNAATGTNQLVSHTGDGTSTGNSESYNPSMSADGQTIAYLSHASDLIGGVTDDNLGLDVFRYNAGTGMNQLVSHTGTGLVAGSDRASFPVVSADGSAIVFPTYANNLVGGSTDANDDRDVVINITATNVNELVSRVDPANPNRAAGATISSVSADGRYVTFVSKATNLVPGQIDTNNGEDIFLLDRQTGLITLVSHTGDGVTTGDGASNEAVISADGSTIAFSTYASNILAGVTDANSALDIFRYTVATGTNELVSHTGDGMVTANSSSLGPVISANGEVIAYVTYATNIHSGVQDDNGTTDIYWYSAGANDLISRHGETLMTANGRSYNPMISGDGSAVVYVSEATDPTVGVTDNNGAADIFRFSYERFNELVSHTGDGLTTGDDGSHRAVINADGTKIAFQTRATDILSTVTDTNGSSDDIYLHDSITGENRLVSHTGDGVTTGNDGSDLPAISADGNFIAYETSATDLVAGVTDVNGAGRDVYRYSAATGTNQLVSHTGDGLTTTNSWSDLAVISGDGSVIAFRSYATNVVSGVIDFNGEAEIYRYSAATGTNQLVSHIGDGVTATNGNAHNHVISANGQIVTFASHAPISANDYNEGYDVYGFDANEPPTVSLQNVAMSLPENLDTTAAVKVADIVITDDIYGTNTLSLTGADAALFEIIGSALYIRAGAVIDFETNPVLDVSVHVDDTEVGETPDDTVVLSIAVTDVNEPPTVALQNITTSLPEDTDTTARVKVADIVITDDAPGINTLSLTGPDAALFEIVGTELFLRAGAALDFETNDSLDVTVEVDDSSLAPSPNDTAVLSISVTDVNEPPTITLQNVIPTLSENADTTARIKVADIVVSDDALGVNTLTLTGADAALFEIDGTELYLRAGTALDFETNSLLDVTVEVDDSELAPSPNDSAPLTIAVIDVNEAPTVSLQNITTSLPEDTDTTIRVKVADIVITDDDLGTNTLSLTGADADLFEIVGTELFLRAGAALDFETNASLDVNVEVNDDSLAPSPNDSATLSIAVTDVNEAPTVTLQNVITTLPEDTDTTARIKVADIVVTDDNLGTNVLSLSGADAALFEIDGMELYLWAGAALDFETNASLDVNVDVDDSQVAPSPNDTATLSIIVTDINEAPTVSLQNVKTTLSEDTDTTARVKVADIVITDDNLGTNVLSLTGDDAALFEIIGTELFLRAGTTLDLNSNPSLDVTVEVDDDSLAPSPNDSAVLSIMVTAGNAAPTVTLQNVTTTLLENVDTSVRIKVADIVINDDGLGTNVLSLSGADAGLFEIDGMELFLRAGVTVDFETNPVLDVTVEVDDPEVGSTPDDSAMLSISVTDVNEAPTVTLQNVTISLPENVDTTARIKVADIVVSDDGLGTNVLSLAGGDASLFEIDGSVLYLRAGVAVDFESNPSLDVIVQVDDAAIGSTPDDSASLSISVSDVNESPTLTITNVTTTLPRNVNNSSRILVAEFSISDPDAGPHTNNVRVTGIDAALFEISGNQVYLIANAGLQQRSNPVLNFSLELDDPSLGTGPEAVANLSIVLTTPTPKSSLPSSFIGFTNGNLWLSRPDENGAYRTKLAARTTFSAWNILQSFQGDFNGDGLEDIAYLMQNGEVQVGIVAADGTLSFNRWMKMKTRDFKSIEVGDFNADGLDDLIGVYQSGSKARLWVYESTGTGFSADDYGTYGSYSGIRTVRVGNFDGVNGDDLAIFNTKGEWWVAKSDAAGTRFSYGGSAGKWDPTRTITNISVGDFNGDGADDLLGVFTGLTNPIQRSFVVAESQGTTFKSTVWRSTTLSGNPDALLVGDFNGDQRDDIAMLIGQQWTLGLSHATDSRFAFSKWGSSSFDGPIQTISVGDTNGDGKADILFRDAANRWQSAEYTPTRFVTQHLVQWSPTALWNEVKVGNFGVAPQPSASSFEAFGDESLLGQLHNL